MFGHGRPKLELRLDDRRYTSGVLIRTHYPWICVRCGGTFSKYRLRREGGHLRKQCDKAVVEVRRDLAAWGSFVLRELALHEALSAIERI
jgi:hypothetical protein